MPYRKANCQTHLQLSSIKNNKHLEMVVMIQMSLTSNTSVHRRCRIYFHKASQIAMLIKIYNRTSNNNWKRQLLIDNKLRIMKNILQIIQLSSHKAYMVDMGKFKILNSRI